MCVNDILVNGGKPIFFLDYFSTSSLNENQLTKIIKSIKKGCDIAGCSLIGGETAEMPGIYKHNDFDIAGFTVGIVERKELINKDKIKKKCSLIGIKSNGFHSNGFSLIRKILETNDILLESSTPYSSEKKKIYEDLIMPTKIYTKEVLPLVKQKLILSMAHITGGGIIENLKRIIPSHFSAVLDFKKFKIPERFLWLAKKGKINPVEMLTTFNCGLGLIMAVEEKNKEIIMKYFNKNEIVSFDIGEILKERRKEKIEIKKLRPWF